MTIRFHDVGWINGEIYETILLQTVIPACRFRMEMGGHSYRWGLLSVDAHPTRWNARVLDTAKVAKLHLLILPSHTTNELQPLDLSVCAVLESSLKTTIIYPTLSLLGEIISRGLDTCPPSLTIKSPSYAHHRIFN